MATANHTINEHLEAAELQSLIAMSMVQQVKGNEKNAGSKAQIIHLSQAIEAVLGELASGKSSDSKIVHLNFKAPEATGSNRSESKNVGKEMSQLAELLSQLETEVAKFGNTNAQANSSIGQSLIKEMQAHIKLASQELEKATKDEASHRRWSIFGKIIGAILGVVFTTIAIVCGQPELAVLTMTLTIMNMSGGMNKLTQGLSDVFTAMGIPKNIAKVLSDICVIVAAMLVTAGTSSGGVVAESIGEDVGNEIEMTTFTEEQPEAVENNEATGEKTKSPLSRKALLGTIAALQTAASTKFGVDLMTAILAHMHNKKTQQILELALGTAIDLLAVLASANVSSDLWTGEGNARYKIGNVSTLMTMASRLQKVGSLLEFAGGTGSGAVSIQLGARLNALGQIQAVLSQLQSLVNTNNQQSSSDAKALISRLRTLASNLSIFNGQITKAEEAINRVLQG